MAWWRGRRGAQGQAEAPDRAGASVDRAHLEEFIKTRRGVEGFVEPPTAVSGVTLLLVAVDGEWTRRRVPSAKWAHQFANKRRVPSYDAAVVGVPARMREWNRRQRTGEPAPPEPDMPDDPFV